MNFKTLLHMFTFQKTDENTLRFDTIRVSPIKCSNKGIFTKTS